MAYVHLLFQNSSKNAKTLYDQVKDKKNDIMLKSLKTQREQFKERAGFSFDSKNLDTFLKEIDYGSKVAKTLNDTIDNFWSGFTSATELTPGFSLADLSFKNAKDIEKIVTEQLKKSNTFCADASAEIEGWARNIDGMIGQMGNYVLSFVFADEKIDAKKRQEIETHIKNGQVVKIDAKAVSIGAKQAIEDYNNLIKRNQRLKEIAKQIRQSANNKKKIIKEFEGAAQFFNTFGGFVGEISNLLALYQAINNKDAKNAFKLLHTGAQKSMKGTYTELTLDKNFKEWLETNSKNSDKKTIKEDVQLLVEFTNKEVGYVKGVVGFNIKNAQIKHWSSDLVAQTPTNKFITFDSTSLEAAIERATGTDNGMGSLPKYYGQKMNYYALASGLSSIKKKDATNYSKENLAKAWKNYLTIIAGANLLVALMGRLNEKGEKSLGNNALIVNVNGHFYSVKDILWKLIENKEISKSLDKYINSQKSMKALGRENNTEVQWDNFKATRDKNVRSKKVETQLESFFGKTLQTKINIDLFNLLK